MESPGRARTASTADRSSECRGFCHAGHLNCAPGAAWRGGAGRGKLCPRALETTGLDFEHRLGRLAVRQQRDFPYLQMRHSEQILQRIGGDNGATYFKTADLGK